MANTYNDTDWGVDANTKGSATSSFTSGYLPYITNVGFGDNDGDAVFIPFINYFEDATNPPNADAPWERICMPYAGYLDKIVFRCSATADTCDFEVYKAVSATASADADQNKLSSTVSVEDDTAHTTLTASFGTDYSFLAGDILAIKMTYESSPGDIDMSVIWKVLID